MNLREEIAEIWGPIQTDYEDEMEGGLDKTVELFKKWALEMVGEDDQPSSEDPYDTNNGLRREIRQRIEESTKNENE